jgi:predicted DsbA family dithiol-disulfide isomerase
MLEFDVEIALSDSKASAAVDADWTYCQEMNVSGVPAFQFGEHWVHGCRGVDALKSLLRVETEE